MAGMHVRRDMKSGRVRVSVITACWNAERTIRRTIESVVGQTVQPDEYIIIDGGSTDGTLDIIRSYGKRVSTLVSEPDGGISDAFNKGIQRANGEFIKLLNADDWLEPDTIEQSISRLEQHPEAGFAFGDLLEHEVGSGRIRRVPGDPGYRLWIGRVMGPLNHPTACVRRSVYEQLGMFDTRWRVAMDYDWFLRVHRRGIAGVYDPAILVNMATGGRATSERRTAFKEVRDISIAHGYPSLLAHAYYAARLGKDLVLRMTGKR